MARPYDLDDLSDDTSAHIKTLESHGPRSRALHAQYRAELAKVHADKYLSAQGKRQKIDALMEWMRFQVKAMATQTQAAQDAIAAAHAKARQDTRSDAAQLLAFQRSQDGADRARKLVASGQSLHQVIAEAGRNGDTALLEGLRRHLRSDLASDEAHNPGIVAEMLKLVSAAEEPHVGEVERSVRGQEARLEQAALAAKWNAQVLATAAESGVGDARAWHFRGIGDDGKQSILEIPEAPAGMPRL